MPGLIGNLVLQVHLETEVAETLGLADPRVVVGRLAHAGSERTAVTSWPIVQLKNHLRDFPLQSPQAVRDAVNHLRKLISTLIGGCPQVILSLKERIQSFFQARNDDFTSPGSLSRWPRRAIGIGLRLRLAEGRLVVSFRVACLALSAFLGQWSACVHACRPSSEVGVSALISLSARASRKDLPELTSGQRFHFSWAQHAG